MAFLSKYGVARHIYWEITKRGVTDLAVGADWTPAAGDVKISKDGGAAANVTNLPTAITMGNTATWDYSLTSTEMQAAQIKITVADAATKAVEDTSFTVETYGNASAQHPFDLATATQSVTATTVSDKTGYALTSGERTSIADALLDEANGVETSWTPRQVLRIMFSVLGGKLDGAATSTVHTRDQADTKNRVTATVDANGNRTAVTLDAS